MIAWIALLVLLMAGLAFDLGVSRAGRRQQTMADAVAWSGFWIGMGLAFNIAVYFAYEAHAFGLGAAPGLEISGRQAATEYFSAYVVEKSLSLDNVFVIALVFSYFKIALEQQRRVLFWGISGAFVMRGAVILVGLDALARFQWLTYVLGAILFVSALKLLLDRHENLELDRSPVFRLLSRFVPITTDRSGDHFFVRRPEGLFATPLFVALVVVETSDLMFAVDSIPAVLAVTRDPFIACSSNAFAILGLRSLYFLIAPLLDRLRYFKISLVFVLAFVGAKLLAVHSFPISPLISLGVILVILSFGVLASVIASRLDKTRQPSDLEEGLDGLLALGIRSARRIAVSVIGGTILLIGIAMILLPGPAFVVIPVGLAVLATEFVWARRWLQRVRSEGERLARSVSRK